MLFKHAKYRLDMHMPIHAILFDVIKGSDIKYTERARHAHNKGQEKRRILLCVLSSSVADQIKEERLLLS